MICLTKVVLLFLIVIIVEVVQGFSMIPQRFAAAGGIRIVPRKQQHDVLLPSDDIITTTTTLSIPSPSLLQEESNDDDDDDDNNNNDGAMKLVYPCQCSYTSEPLPAGTTEDDIWEFFRKPSTRHLIFSGGGKFIVEDQPEMALYIHDMWMNACDYFQLPKYLHPNNINNNKDMDNNDDVVMAVSLTLEFPGLKIMTTSLNGIKLLSSSSSSSSVTSASCGSSTSSAVVVNGSSGNSNKNMNQKPLPQFHCILLGEKQHVTGAAPLVWLYKRITGLHGGLQKNQHTYQPSSAKAQSQFSVIQTDQGQYAFCLDCNLSVIMHVPKHLVRLLGATFPKEKIEALGTAAVARIIPQGVASSVISARDAFDKEHLMRISNKNKNNNSNKKMAPNTYYQMKR